MRLASLLSPLALALPLAALAASPAPVKTAPRGTPLTVSAAQGAQVIKIAKLFSDTPDKRIGTRRYGYFCKEAGEYRLAEKMTRYMLGLVRDALHAELEKAGYPKAPVSAFEQESADASIEYQLGLNLADAQVEVCFNEDKSEGGVWLRADIELYAPRERKVVFRGSFEGHEQTAPGKWVPEDDVFIGAARFLVRNLLASPEFVEHATRKALSAGGAAGSSQQAVLKLVKRHEGKGMPAQQQMPLLQSSVATVFSGAGSGSAFLLAADGHWLSNHHVVGDAKYVKLKLANGRELLGEVLRSDVRRDVAVIKTESVALAPFEVAEAEPGAGAEVYAIGSPLGDKLEGTVTRGIVSSLREIEGRRFLQSDVKVLPGSSGGPLIDGRGAVVAMTSGGIGNIATGMNLFIPVREVMAALKLEFK